MGLRAWSKEFRVWRSEIEEGKPEREIEEGRPETGKRRWKIVDGERGNWNSKILLPETLVPLNSHIDHLFLTGRGGKSVQNV